MFVGCARGRCGCMVKRGLCGMKRGSVRAEGDGEVWAHGEARVVWDGKRKCACRRGWGGRSARATSAARVWAQQVLHGCERNKVRYGCGRNKCGASAEATKCGMGVGAIKCGTGVGATSAAWVWKQQRAAWV
eukprot:364466-Chlamydomonas_euryale.AAC.17